MLDGSDQVNEGPLVQFEQQLRALKDIRTELSADLVGKGIDVPGPFGAHKMVYADYVASGRALSLIERFVLEEVLPYYANSHTEASFCGATMTRIRQQARQIILEKCRGNETDHAVVFTGSGATSGLNKLVHLFGVTETLRRGGKVQILVGPYEHHSNILPWRESGAQVTELREGAEGGVDLKDLESALSQAEGADLLICACSAASNVTGALSDVAAVTRLVKAHGGLMVWDYAGGAPYLPIDMMPENLPIDAIVLSPHKFIGGPGASGVLLVRRDAVVTTRPSQPGGGTVAFVNGQMHDYLTRIEDREEGGTPNVVGDIRAALAFIVKDALGEETFVARNRALARRAFEEWDGHAALRILGAERRDRLPIFSFCVETEDGADFDYQIFTRALSDLYGIQARGGCACAGPYVHRLLSIDDARSAQLRNAILAGDESGKPGFVRLNLSVLMSDEEVDFILNSVKELANRYASLQQMYAPLERPAVCCGGA